MKIRAFYETFGKLFPCAVVYCLRRCPRDVHAFGALFLIQAEEVYQSDGFKFIDCHGDLFCRFVFIKRSEAGVCRH